MDDQIRATLTDLLPAYAVGALDEEELRFVERHLGDYPECAGELGSLLDTAALLALTTPPVAPPPALKRTLLARVERLEAATDAANLAVRAEAEATTRPRLLTFPSATSDAAQPGIRRYRAALVAVAAVLLVALTGWNTFLQLQLRAERQQNATLAVQSSEALVYERLLNNPQAAHAVIGTGPGRYNLPPAGYIYTDPASDIAVMLTYWLPPLNPGQQYQLWLVTPEGTRDNGGVFNDDGKGNAHVTIHAPAPFAKYQSVGVTIEPTGGSPGPTGQRVIGGDIR